MRELDLELRELRLDLIDRLSPYGIKVEDLNSFDDELRAIAELPLNKRRKQFNRFMDKIRTHLDKTMRIKRAETN